MLKGKTSKAASGNMGFARISCFRTLRVTKKKRIWYQGALVKNMVNHGILVKNMVNHGILAKIMVSLCTILHGHGILAKIMARSWQDLGKDTKELAMDLGKDAMASNTGYIKVLPKIRVHDIESFVDIQLKVHVV